MLDKTYRVILPEKHCSICSFHKIAEVFSQDWVEFCIHPAIITKKGNYENCVNGKYGLCDLFVKKGV